MNSRHIRSRKQAGFTLVELGIVLALIGIGLFFAISKINETNDQSKAQNVANDITFTITNVKRLFATQAAFPSDDKAYANDILRNNAVYPATWNDPGDEKKVVTPFTGTPTIKRNTPEGQQAGNYAAITIDNVPSRVCTELARVMATGISQLEVVSGKVVKPLGGSLNVDELGKQCTSTKQVTMIFTFARN